MVKYVRLIVHPAYSFNLNWTKSRIKSLSCQMTRELKRAKYFELHSSIAEGHIRRTAAALADAFRVSEL